MSHRTETGRAVAVADTPPAVAVAVYGCQMDGSIHSHVGRSTTLNDAGLVAMFGTGRRMWLAACAATVDGATEEDVGFLGTPPGTQTSPLPATLALAPGHE